MDSLIQSPAAFKIEIIVVMSFICELFCDFGANFLIIMVMPGQIKFTVVVQVVLWWQTS